MAQPERDWRVPLRTLYDLRVWRPPAGCICLWPLGGRVPVLRVELDIGCPWHGIMSESPVDHLPPMVLGEAR